MYCIEVEKMQVMLSLKKSRNFDRGRNVVFRKCSLKGVQKSVYFINSNCAAIVNSRKMLCTLLELS